MPRRGENVRKRKDGRWEGRYISGYDENGKAKYTSVYSRSYCDLKKKLKQVKLLKKRDRDQNSMKFREIVFEWIYGRKLQIKESTFVRYCNMIEKHIIPNLGNLLLEDLNSKVLETFLQEKAVKGRLDGRGGLSAGTVRILAYIMKSALNYAAAEGYMEPVTMHTRLPKEGKKELNVLTLDEQRVLEYQMLKDMDGAKLGILICLYTGLRIGEICALKWSDVHFEKGMLYVRRTVQRIQIKAEESQNVSGEEEGQRKKRPKTKLMISDPKSTSSTREIPIPEFLKKLLRKTAETAKADGYILTGTEKIMEPRTYANRFKKYLQEAGLKDRNFHTLRHTFATRCIELGFDAKTLSLILGHSNISMTLNRYVHPPKDLKRRQMELLSVNWGQNQGQQTVGKPVKSAVAGEASWKCKF